MSDPGTYRSKEEVEQYKKADPIEQILSSLKTNNWIDEKGIEKMEEKIKAIVEECVQFAEQSPFPATDELYKDVYVQTDYPFIKE